MAATKLMLVSVLMFLDNAILKMQTQRRERMGEREREKKKVL